MKKRPDLSAIILAGGNSTRMNRNKANMKISGVSLIERTYRSLEQYFEEIIISSKSGVMFDFLPHKVAVDEKPDRGPLMGILSGLKASKNPVNFVIACDIPEINYSFVDEMISYVKEYDIVVPVTGENKYEPLFAFYNKSLIPTIENLLIHGSRKISKLFSECKTKYLQMKNRKWFLNLNTIEDYNDYMDLLKKRNSKEE